jgi:NTE family protein
MRRWAWAALAAAFAGALAEAAPDPATPVPPAAANAVPVGPPPNRPRIGLVLSGGGARGTAHVGVLKVLDELNVPIDAIAGTSVGAVVGGLYASGLSAREIESVITSLNWQDAFGDRSPRADLTFRRKQEDQNFLVNFPLGIRGSRLLLPKGLIQGQRLNQTLRRLTLPVAAISDFDRLPASFRAVAADLETGEPYVMSDGDLTTAMRASMSAPGLFAPVERGGHLLVDGGIAENLPIDVARSMNVDVLIVVDVGFPLLKRDRLASAPVISNQMLAILVRRDSQRQRATLTERDIVIDPPLGETSSFDFRAVDKNIAAGERAARAMASRLRQLSISPEQHRAYVALRETARMSPPKVEFVTTEKGRYERSLTEWFGSFIGQPLSAERLADRVTQYYGRGNLEMLDYQLVRENDRYGLSFSARRNSWGPNYLRFGLNLQDDFEGNATYNAAARLVLAEITEPGGEWVLDGQIGENPRLATEVYLPLSQTSPYFLSPHLSFEARDVPLLSNQERIAEFRVRSFLYGLDLGREFSNWGEIRAGIRRQTGHSSIILGDPTLPTTDFDARSYFVRLSYDKLDDVNFPRHGQLASVEWIGETTGLGSDATLNRLDFNYLMARSLGRNTAVLWTSAGSILNDVPQIDVRNLFTLGGFFNLSGLKANSVAGPDYAIVRMLLYRQIGRGGPGFLDVPAYAGISLEAGNVWEQRDAVSFGSARKDMSVFLGLDTLFGPLYLGAGFEEGGGEAFYLFLGRTF